MKVLILGGNGMLGHKLVQVLQNKFDVWCTIRGNSSVYINLDLFNETRTIENLDVINFSSVKKTIYNVKPEVIINAIGIIKQKDDSKNIIKTLEINALFPHKVAKIASEINARFITLSTDCVFNGSKGNYFENDLPNATDLYGKSKNLGEVVNGDVLTLRTSIIGRELSTTKSLVEWFLNTEENPIKGFTQAIYSGFPTIILAEFISEIIEKHKKLKGLYHLSSEPINKFDLLQLINNKLRLNKEIIPFDDFKIDRSLNSDRLRKKINYTPQSWGKLIERMLDDPTPYIEWRKRIS